MGVKKIPNTIIDGLKERVSKAAKINQSVGIIVPGNNYEDLLNALFDHMKTSDKDIWTYVTINRPYQSLSKKFGNIATAKNIRFIDCISRAAGMSELTDNCIFIESPTMLEKTSMEIMEVFRTNEDDCGKYVIIDSLSALMIYNDPQIVRQFFYHLINKTHSGDIHCISLVVEEEMDQYINKIIFLNDKILKVRDSFI